MPPPASPVPQFPAGASSATSGAARGCLALARGAFLLLGAIGVGGLGWLVLNILAGDLRKSPEHIEGVDAFAMWVIEHRMLVPLLALPPAIAGIWMVARRATVSGQTAGRRATPWLVVAFATLWLVAMFGVVLATFIMFLAPLYEYRDI